MDFIVDGSYFIAAILFIFGLKRMSSPVTARRGIVWAGVGMVLATIITYFHKDIHHNYVWMSLAILIGGAIAWVTAKRVKMTDMPQMIALYNGMGGGAAAAIAAVILMQEKEISITLQVLAVFGALIGTIALSGSMIAFAKLQGLMWKTYRFPNQQWVNLFVFLVTLIIGFYITFSGTAYGMGILSIFFILALIFGVLMTIPIGGADMPVVISLYNAFTGLAVGFEGYVIGNPAMMIAGIVVGSAGTMLTQLMAKAMNRPITNVLFSNFGDGGDGKIEAATGSMKEIDANDVAVMMAFAEKVIIVPGYGMAVAQAQHKVWEMTKLLQERGVTVKFAIHPVAGRMPGHMNVLLAEAGVPYDIIYDLDEINEEFETTDVTLVIGANDVVNPAARTDTNSPIYGMPILNADASKNTIVIKRGKGTGFTGIENQLFFAEKTNMLYGDGATAVSELITAIKEL